MVERLMTNVRKRSMVLVLCWAVIAGWTGACVQTAAPATSTATAATTPGPTLRGWTALETLEQFGQAWSQADYPGMYGLLSPAAQARISAADFAGRYQAIADTIASSHPHLQPVGSTSELPADAVEALLSYSVQMTTLAGAVTIQGYTMTLIRAGNRSQADWRIDWQDGLIFPGLQPTDQIQANRLWPRRGEIFDRSGQPLAINDQLITIGIVPRAFKAVQDEAVPQMARLLDISQGSIIKKLSANPNPDWFVPIVTLPAAASDLAAKLTALDGVQYQMTDGRVYPAGQAAAHLIGTVGAITAEELEKYQDRGYQATDQIGKMGLEQVFEERLRGRSGAVIYRVNADGTAVLAEIARREAVDGEDIHLALAMNVQKRLYQAIQDDHGTAAAIDPRSGEILALVSAPSFDPNLLQTYVPDTIRKAWNDPANTFFTNRFKARSVPGSVFKLVTAAIGLRLGTLNPDDPIAIKGLKWQPDTSWGKYQVTRVRDSGGPVDLAHAFINSDNIFFAQAGLAIGRAAFADNATAFGIGEALLIDYPLAVSQLSNEGLTSDILLADTSYGQGEILITPLHVALIYSALANQGDILAPVLEHKDGWKPLVWKNQAIAARDVQRLTDCLIQAIEDPDGGGYTEPASQARLLGKTGTAELKTSAADPQARENGWFVAMNVDQPRLVVVMMIEAVQDRNGSHYVVPLVKAAMDDLLFAE